MPTAWPPTDEQIAEAPRNSFAFVDDGYDVDANADTDTIVRSVIDYYNDCLKQCPEAVAHIEKRSLRDSTMIDHFRLAFCSRTLAYRIPAKNRKAGAAIELAA